jgi:hypothetical protein
MFISYEIYRYIFYRKKKKFTFCNGSSVTVIQLKLKNSFHATAMLLLYILQKITFTKIAYFLKTCYHTSFQDPILSGVSIASTSQVCCLPYCYY